MMWDPAMRSRSSGRLKNGGLVAVFLLTLAVPGLRLGASRYQLPGAQVNGISQQAIGQIHALMAEKMSRTPTQQKINSHLLAGARVASGQSIAAGLPALQVPLPMTSDNRVILDVRAPVSDALLDRLRGLGVEVTDADVRYQHVGVKASLDLVESIASLPQVLSVAPDLGWITSRSTSPALRMVSGPQSLQDGVERKRAQHGDLVASVRRALQQRNAGAPYQGAITNTGTVSSQGDTTHRAGEARSAFGVSGSGVRIGVLSDGVDSVAASQASGNLGPVTVLPGQAGSGDEGTAMLEIVADLAPGAQLYFATAIGGPTQFAQNIRDLRSAGCDIIVDDVFYFVETPFQDGQTAGSFWNGGVVIQAVKEVAASGALYFSSAGNFGNLDAGTSGTWEGDFADGGAVGGPIAAGGGTGQVHSFGSATFNVLTVSAGNLNTLYWSDPLGGSANDYDLFLLDSTGMSVVDFSNDFQDGTGDPFEFVSPGSAGQRLVIVKYNGAGRFLHLSTNGSRLSVATTGQIHGHAAVSGGNAFGVAATPASGPYPGSFNSGSDLESFTSDGPRRIFYTATGAPITPGNFSSSGGQVLAKPDLTAADGVSTSVAGFTSFYGTSAAAPHAAAIAALVKSANAAPTAGQVSTALIGTAIDIHATGFDRDSGYGIVMAYPAVQSVVLLAVPTGLSVTRTGPSSATITWSPSAGATSYNVRFSLAPGGSQTLLINTTSTSTSISELTRGQRYYFVVSALNAGGESSNSPPVAFVIPTLTIQGDIDGDARADLTVWRASTGTWYWTTSSSGYTDGDSRQWGNQSLGDVPLNGDLDGDGRGDLIVWRASTGTWYWTTSESGYTDGGSKQWGNQGLGDVPFVSDIDGDAKVDLIVWRASTGTWHWTTSSTGYAGGDSKQWGNQGLGDVPLLGDLDGDARADLVVWRASTGTWYWTTSSTGYIGGGSQQFGNQSLGDVPMLGDVDGDGKTDLLVWRASTGTWYWTTSSTGYLGGDSRQWGNQGLGDVPRPRDLDGDGRMDLAVWRASNGTWYWLTSSTGYSSAGAGSKQFGSQSQGDLPMPR